MKRCSKCGSAESNGAQVCSRCGAAFDSPKLQATPSRKTIIPITGWEVLILPLFLGALGFWWLGTLGAVAGVLVGVILAVGF